MITESFIVVLFSLYEVSVEENSICVFALKIAKKKY
jgi:hypothetical protein